MDTNMNSKISSFANKEGIKTEMLNLLIDLYKEHDLQLGNKAKEFVLVRTEQLLNYYDVTAEIPVKIFQLKNGQQTAPCVELATFDKVFEDFRTKMSQIFLQLISHDLGRFIEDNTNEEKQ